MKSIPTFLFLLAALCLTIGCYENKTAPKYPIEGAVNLSQPAAPAAGASINPNVKHYTCAKNCAGSGGDAAGSCPVCGDAYVHNDAYHNNTAAPTPNPAAAAGAAAGAANTQTSTSTINFSDPNSTEPAQNAAGVWHYTCGAGCAGGAGAAGNCATCGGALAHNTAYH